jgi:hypothetical protein
MVLGAINTTINPTESLTQSEFDFSPLETRVKTLEERQKYLMIALALLALYVILKK